MRPTGHRFEITGVVVGSKTYSVVDPGNDLADERAQFGGAILDILGRGHWAVDKLSSECAAQVICQLRLRDRCAVEIDGLTVMTRIGQKPCIGVGELGASGVAAFSVTSAIRDLTVCSVAVDIIDVRLDIDAIAADAGSLSAAGRRLKLSTSVVSHHLSRIETKMGTTLFFRSTRSISLTAEGHAALAPARRMVVAGEEALDALNTISDEPVGALRITMPAWGERTRLRLKLWEFARLHPLVSILIQSSDIQADLVKEGIDLAIRLGTLADSRLKSLRITDFGRVLVASPDYLASRQAVETFEDLAACDFIAVSMLPDAISFECDGKSVSFQPEKVRLEVDTIVSAKSAILAGLGVRHLPLGEVEEEIALGKLVKVMPQWSVPDLGVYAVWPDFGPK